MSNNRKPTLAVMAGDKKAVFIREELGWRPDWFYLKSQPMLRFKDHEWLSIGHVHPAHASHARRLRGGGLAFRGTARYGKTRVPWAVTIQPDPDGTGFLVECQFKPAASIELLEAYSTFETPYDYDGTESVTTVLGMNPAARWDGGARQSPPIWENPAWVYSRPQAVRITGPCSAPFLCQSLTRPGGAGDRHVTVVGDWTVCRVHDVYVAPTRSTRHDPPSVWGNAQETRGYKYVVGALNWSSAFTKDPNVLYAGGHAHRQRLALDFEAALPGGTMDALLLQGWQRAAAFSLPAGGAVDACERAERRGATWHAATRWLRGVFCGDGIENLYLRGKGICTYAVGSRPKAGGDYSFFWWPQWCGGFHYRALLTNDAELSATCDRLDAEFVAAAAKGQYWSGQIAMGVVVLPMLHWVRGAGRTGLLAEALRKPCRDALDASAAENGKPRDMDHGSQAAIAECLLLCAELYGDAAFRDQALVLLGEMNAQLDGEFWAFNCGKRGSLVHGGQVRPLGHGHAAVANLLAWRATRREDYLVAARRFARYLLAMCYATHNGSQDPDFDWRGWANGSNAGRDQIAEFPPWETQNGLLCLAALMDDADLEPGFHDVLWYIARTGLAQFPAARTLKRILGEDMQPRYVPRRTLASERDFYDNVPYLAYENPHDQTLLASYQGTDCLLGELVYGGGLARAADPRVGVVVPRAALLDERELTERRAVAWNPLRKTLRTTLTVTWPDGSTAARKVVLPPRHAVEIVLSR